MRPRRAHGAKACSCSWASDKPMLDARPDAAAFDELDDAFESGSAEGWIDLVVTSEVQVSEKVAHTMAHGIHRTENTGEVDDGACHR